MILLRGKNLLLAGAASHTAIVFPEPFFRLLFLPTSIKLADPRPRLRHVRRGRDMRDRSKHSAREKPFDEALQAAPGLRENHDPGLAPESNCKSQIVERRTCKCLGRIPVANTRYPVLSPLREGLVAHRQPTVRLKWM